MSEGAAVRDPDDYAAEIGAALFARDNVSRNLGMELLAVSEGFSKLAMPVTEEMMSGFGMLHGGIVFTLADSAFAFACNSRNEMHVALQCSISFHASARPGEKLIATAQERSRTSRTGIYDIDVVTEDGRLVALFRGIPYRLNRSSI